jgi:hypothetical protein
MAVPAKGVAGAASRRSLPLGQPGGGGSRGALPWRLTAPWFAGHVSCDWIGLETTGPCRVWGLVARWDRGRWPARGAKGPGLARRATNLWFAARDKPLVCADIGNESDQVKEGHLVDALALRGDEGRGTLR